MSGGVDSSVAAALLVEQGCDVVGVTMKLHEDGSDLPDRPCCSLDATSDARRVCEALGVPHYVVNLVDRFGHDVLDDFVQEYARGRTPIPCVRCNTFTKFRDLLATADVIDARWVATGHYARVDAVDGRRALRRGLDPTKDQSYFLWGIARDVLDRLAMPVGAMSKAETRAIAHRFGLRTAAKPESQDICFVPDGDHARVIAERLGPDAPALQRGPLRLVTGEVVGEHAGFARYTIGQRKGLPGGFAEPMYVVAIVPEERAVVIGPRAALLGRGVVARQLNWLADPPSPGAHVSVQVRNRARAVPATMVRCDTDEVELALEEPVVAITPGQSLVLYAPRDDGDIVLGGGVIERGHGAAVAGRRRAALPILAA
jgi:tRNA-specific 2-thiouridylase